MESFVAVAGTAGAALLALAWVVYPAGIGLLALVFRKPSEWECPAFPVSVVLATRDDPEVVRRRIRNLLDTGYPEELLRIVVAVDGGSSHPLSAHSEIAEWPGVRVVRGPEPGGKAVTLNRGVEEAAGEILAFADASQRFAPETIPNLLAPFSDPEIGAVSGRLVLRRRRRGPSLVDLYWSFERWLRSREARLHSPVGVTGAVSAMRASLWEPLPPGLILDDLYTPMRLVLQGHRIAFVDEAVAFETRRPTPEHEYRRKARTLTGNLQLCAWLPQVLLPWRNPLFVQFALHKLARLLTPYALSLVVLWGTWTAVTHFPRLALAGLGLAGGAAVWAGLGRTEGARRLRGAFVELALTQAAVVRATANGLRGRWDVWR